MDRIESMRLFVRVVERRSFTAAARDLGIPRSTATTTIAGMEKFLNCRLLDRTTRVVNPTVDGQIYYSHCLSILTSIDEAESSFRNPVPSGLLRIDAHGQMTRTFILPKLSEFLGKYPQVELHIGQGDRLVDLIREGVDCVIRLGDPNDSGLIRRSLASIDEITCASPNYVKRAMGFQFRHLI
jgi:DNA-binding transcriptional LysR family regulator